MFLFSSDFTPALRANQALLKWRLVFLVALKRLEREVNHSAP
jgi:hypothetical protein